MQAAEEMKQSYTRQFVDPLSALLEQSKADEGKVDDLLELVLLLNTQTLIEDRRQKVRITAQGMKSEQARNGIGKGGRGRLAWWWSI